MAEVRADLKRKGHGEAPRPRKRAELDPLANNQGGEVYCICKKPDNGERMIGCDHCEDWFHCDCVGVSVVDEPKISTYACPRCVEKGLAITWKPKCRLETCINSADTANRSKFCSEAHGVEFFRKKARQLAKSNVSPEQLAALAKPYEDMKAFKEVGRKLPQSEGDDSEQQQQLGSGEFQGLTEEKEDAQKELANWKALSTFLGLLKERVKVVNDEADVSQGICGYDPIVTDPEWEVIKQCVEEPAAIDQRDTHLCMEPKRKCKHQDWYLMATRDASHHISEISDKLSDIDRKSSSVLDDIKLKKLAAPEYAVNIAVPYV
ncbi:hypothetical protein TRVA0_002S01266 [Trichomonascus vanleenenianus]|uniref:Spp1p n=1 Tax=Trichomonascus vanleenenianus TaxID=2268995 RepID=UPI003ECA3773